MIKKILLQSFKSMLLQPLWEKLFHYSKIGMNYWGTEVEHSGEIQFLMDLSHNLTIIPFLILQSC